MSVESTPRDDRTLSSRPVTNCQVCGSIDLNSVLFLGYVPPVNTMPPIDSVPTEEVFFPLELLRCERCTLVQIGLEVDPNVLFPPDYPYRSASTKILRENFSDLCRESRELLELTPDDLVLDIGSNDGTLLRNFADQGHRVLGIEPSEAALEAASSGIPSKMAFFDQATAKEVLSEHGPAKLVTAANVFAHMPTISDVVEAIKNLLTPDGVFVSESHYLPSLVESLQYDTIYHEHLRYYSLGSLSYLLNKGGLEVFHATRIPTHGGSIRAYAAVPGRYEIRASVEGLLREEREQRITDGSLLEDFRRRAIQSKLRLHALLEPLVREGSRVYGIGAPSRASTLINYVGMDEGIMPCVLEISSSAKLNRFIPGTRIPVLDEEKLFTDQPEYALLLSWHIADELMGKLVRKGFRGDFIVPLPTPRIVSNN